MLISAYRFISNMASITVPILTKGSFTKDVSMKNSGLFFHKGFEGAGAP